MPHILIVEDEPSIADSLIFVLRQESFTTHWEDLASAALIYVRQNPVDLIIMDVGLPDMNGFEACKQLRQISDIPVIFLTARGDELDRVVGLEIGADDYVVKPFSPREVAARVKAILKRTAREGIVTPSEFRDVNELQAPMEFHHNPERKTLSYQHQVLPLTRMEYQLLLTLVTNPGRVFSRDQLLTAVGASADAAYDRNIDGHIKALRAKLREVAPGSEVIKTVRGFGYTYEPKGMRENLSCR